MTRRPSLKRRRYAILVNGRTFFYLCAGSQIGAVIKAQEDLRYLSLVQELGERSLMITAVQV